MVPFKNYPPENEIGNTKTTIASVQITKKSVMYTLNTLEAVLNKLPLKSLSPPTPKSIKAPVSTIKLLKFQTRSQPTTPNSMDFSCLLSGRPVSFFINIVNCNAMCQ